MKQLKHTFLIKLSQVSKWLACGLFIGLFGGLFVNAATSAEQETTSSGTGSSSAESSKKIPFQCITNCETNYGVVLGQSPAGVPAYSNCNAECVIFEPNHLNDIYTGIKWQCVEYARRWLLQERGVVFGDVDIAADIWVM